MKTKRDKTRDIADVCKRATALVASQPQPSVALVKPASLAKNSLERAAALFLQKIQPDYLAGYVQPRHRQFMFRCVYVPLFCKAVIEWQVRQEGAPKYWLWQHGTYLLAFERTLVEMRSRKAIKLDDGVLNAFADPYLDYRYWLRRFDQWRAAASASYRYFIQKQSPQIRKSAQRGAAYLGTIKNLCGGDLPKNLFVGMLARINSDASAAVAFNKIVKKIKPARWGEPALDTWLIEIWPLVTEYGWNYHDVWRVGNEKWDVPEAAPFESVARFSDRCKKMLGLKLSRQGGAKQGHPKNVGVVETPPLPSFAAMAKWIQSIGEDEEEWIRGQLPATLLAESSASTRRNVGFAMFRSNSGE